MKIKIMLTIASAFFVICSADWSLTRANAQSLTTGEQDVLRRVEMVRKDVHEAWRSGRIQDGFAANGKAIKAIRDSKIRAPALLAELLTEQGIFLRTVGTEKDSTASFNEALNILEGIYGVDAINTFTILLYLSDNAQTRDDKSAARDLLFKTIRIVKEKASPTDIRITYSLARLADMSRKAKNNEDAIRYYKESYEIQIANVPEPQAILSVIYSTIQIIELLIENNDGPAALQFIYIAKAMIDRALQNAAVGSVVANGVPDLEKQLKLATAKYHLAKGDTISAQRILEETIVMVESRANPRPIDVMSLLGQLVDIAAKQNDWPTVEKASAKLADLSSNIWSSENPIIAFNKRTLARSQYKQKKWSEAAASFQHALKIATAPRNRTANFEEFFSEVASFALEAAAATEITASKRSFISLAFDSLQWKLRGSAGQALSKAAARRNVSGGQLTALFRERDSILDEINAAERLVNAEVSRPFGQRNFATAQRLREMVSIKTSRSEAIETQISDVDKDYAELSQISPVSLQEAQSNLADNESIIILSGGEQGILLAISKTYVGWTLFDAKQTSLRIADLKCGIISSKECSSANKTVSAEDDLIDRSTSVNSTFSLEKSSALFGSLFNEHVKRTISGKEIIYYLADGFAADIPLGLLVTLPPKIGGSEKERLQQASWLIKSHAVTMVVSIRSIFSKQPINRSTNVLPFFGIGDPGHESRSKPVKYCDDDQNGNASHFSISRYDASAEYGESPKTQSLDEVDGKRSFLLPTLPASGCELTTIAGMLGAELSHVYLRESARESVIKELSIKGVLRQYRMISFATHGLLSGELGSNEPALVLTPPVRSTAMDDGLLTASEIANLDLDADWVVLSACNSAGGDGRSSNALAGLSRAFFYAGARGALVSHWPVYSEAAVQLTIETVRNVQMNPNLTTGQALRLSALKLLAGSQTEVEASPAYWAPFSYVGR